MLPSAAAPHCSFSRWCLIPYNAYLCLIGIALDLSIFIVRNFPEMNLFISINKQHFKGVNHVKASFVMDPVCYSIFLHRSETPSPPNSQKYSTTVSLSSRQTPLTAADRLATGKVRESFILQPRTQAQVGVIVNPIMVFQGKLND